MFWQVVRRGSLWVVGLVSFLVISCATITVNVYFPQKEVKSAFKSLEEELLQPQAPPQPAPSEKPKSALPPEEKPVVSRPEAEGKTILLQKTYRLPLWAPRVWRLSLAEALAQQVDARQITEEIKQMPEVRAAYQRRSQRLQAINRLKDQGVVGEGNSGKLAIRVEGSQMGSDEMKSIEQENADRDIIVTGMAKAILKLNKLEASESNIERVRPQAAEVFASVNREAAKPGWWIQLPDGSWKKK